jgi:hypothetical protein
MALVQVAALVEDRAKGRSRPPPSPREAP